MDRAEPDVAEALSTERTTEPADEPAKSDDEQDRPGRIGRWISRDPVRAVALVLIVIQLLVRADIASRGYLAQDDIQLAVRAAGSHLTGDYLLHLFNNHLMPGGLSITWLFTSMTALAYWPYLLLMVAGQAILNVTFYRLLRSLLPPGWGMLAPLSLFLFSPLGLEVTTWWVFGMYMLPMELAMVLAIGAQVKYVRTKRIRHLVTLALSLLLGLIFGEKAMLIVPLLFVLTACFFVNGGPLRSTVRTVRRYWPAWLMLSVMSVAYLWIYQSRAVSSLREPASTLQALAFVRQLIGSTLVPGLMGGPWQWLTYGVVAPSPMGQWLAWAALLGVVVVTIWRRPVAVRAWAALAIYVVLDTGLLGATRLGGALSDLAGLVPRYVSDVVVVAALCTGVALLGLRDTADRLVVRPWPVPAALRTPGAIAAQGVVVFALVAAMVAGTAVSTAGFANTWAVQPGRDYLRAAAADLRTAPPDTVFLDEAVPAGVLAPYDFPENLQSRVFRAAGLTPTFVTQGEHPSVFDQSGHIRPAWVEGRNIRPGPDTDCGYLISNGETVRIELDGPLIEWPWTVRVGYLSSGTSTVTFRLGNAVHQFDVHNGLSQMFFRIDGGGEAIELAVEDPTVTVCTSQITVGRAVPWMY
jgi:hypothetical protein